MKTYLVDGTRPSSLDDRLLNDLRLSNDLPQIGEQHVMRIGVENEFGEIYRIIEIGDVLAKKKLLDRLRLLDYWIDPLAPDAEDSLSEIIKFGKQ